MKLEYLFLLRINDPGSLEELMVPYTKRIRNAYRSSYGEERKGRWYFRYNTPEIIDKANLELKYLWENPS